MRDAAGARVEEIQGSWISGLETILKDLRAERSSMSTRSARERLNYAVKEAYEAKVVKVLEMARVYRPLAIKPASNQLIPAERLNYRDMSEEARCDFWSGKWDLELAYNIYD